MLATAPIVESVMGVCQTWRRTLLYLRSSPNDRAQIEKVSDVTRFDNVVLKPAT